MHFPFSFFSHLAVPEGADGGDATSAGDQAAEPTAKHEAAADNDAKPSTTTTGSLIKAVVVVLFSLPGRKLRRKL